MIEQPRRFACRRRLAALPLLLTAAVVACSPRGFVAGEPSAKDPIYRHSQGRYVSRVDTIDVTVTEGTEIAFDLARAGDAILFDLYGQLWEVPIGGGEARLIAAEPDWNATSQFPAVSPDGSRIAAWSDRLGGRGLWVTDRAGGDAQWIFGRADSTFIMSVGVRFDPAWSADGRYIGWISEAPESRLRLYDVIAREQVEVPVWELPQAPHRSVAWAGDGAHLAIAIRAGALWEVTLPGGTAQQFTPAGVITRGQPAYSPQSDRIAYFAATPEGEVHVLVQARGGEPIVVAAGPEIEPRRVRWSADGEALIYVERGRFRRVPAGGGTATEIPFTATLRLPRTVWEDPRIRLRAPGDPLEARGFTGLALSPAGDRIAMLAVGRLWAWPVGGEPRAVSVLPPNASGISWSPDGTRVVWSGGSRGSEDLHVTDVVTGSTRLLTGLVGSESHPSWSPDGRTIAFIHWSSPGLGLEGWQADAVRRVRLVRTDMEPARGESQTVDVGELPIPYPVPGRESSPTTQLHWLDDGAALLIAGFPGWPAYDQRCGIAFRLDIQDRTTEPRKVPCSATMVQVAADDHLVYIQDGLLYEAGATVAGWTEGRRLSERPALYPTVSRSGAILYVTPDGLSLRGPSGEEEEEEVLGWPLTTPVAEAPFPILVRNLRIVDLAQNGGSDELSDVLIRSGRFEWIGPAGTLEPPAADIVDAEGRYAIPGMVDAHIHLFDGDPAVLAIALANGVTTAREMWTPIAQAAAFRDAVDAGMLAGPRLVLSGTPFYPGPVPRSVTSDLMWLAEDSTTIARGLDLMTAFGIGHVKMRVPRTSWIAGAELIRQARLRGLPISGHCAHPLPLVAAGITGNEHLDGQCAVWPFIADDIPKLFAEAGIAVTPTNYHFFGRAAITRDRSALERMPGASHLTPMLRLAATGIASDEDVSWMEAAGRTIAARSRQFHDLGVELAAGSDASEIPGSYLGEVESFVNAGLSPVEALRIATIGGAGVLGVSDQVGAIRVGLLGDLVLLDADPRENIYNLQRIWRVYKGGAAVYPN